LLDVLRGFKGFDLVFEDLYLLSAYLPVFEEIDDDVPSGEKDRKRTACQTRNGFGLPDQLYTFVAKSLQQQ